MPRSDPAERARVLVRRAECVKLREAGYSFAEIARELGYSSEQVASTDYRRGLSQYLQFYVDEQKEPIERQRAKELALLDEALVVARRVLNTRHLAHSGGNIVRRNIGTEEEPDWVELHDDAPALAAADRVVKISESRRKLLGQDAPSKVEAQIGGSVEYVIKVDSDEMDKL